MEIPVLVEPSPTGFRATTGAPLVLTADGPTADAALAALRTVVADRLRNGTQLRSLSVNGQPGPTDTTGQVAGVPPLRSPHVTDVQAVLQWVRDHPMSEEQAREHERVVEEYRREHNTIPDPNDEF